MSPKAPPPDIHLIVGITVFHYNNLWNNVNVENGQGKMPAHRLTEMSALHIQKLKKVHVPKYH